MTNKWVLEQAKLEAEGRLAEVTAQRNELVAAIKTLLLQMDTPASIHDLQAAFDRVNAAVDRTKGE